MKFVVPLLHGANRLIRSLSSLQGIKTFVENDAENPAINYHHMPMRGLYELTRLVEAVRVRLPQIQRPVLLLQGTEDPVVVPASVEDLEKELTASEVELHRITSTLHGIAYGNIGNTWHYIIDFVKRMRTEALHAGASG